MYIKPSELSDETMEVLDLFDDEIQFFDISFDETVKSYAISVWVYRDGEWSIQHYTYSIQDSGTDSFMIWEFSSALNLSKNSVTKVLF